MSCGDPPWPAKSDGDRLLDALAEAMERRTYKPAESPQSLFQPLQRFDFPGDDEPVNLWQTSLDLTSGTCPVCKSKVDPDVKYHDTTGGLIGCRNAPLRYVDGYVCINERCSIIFKRRPGDVWVERNAEQDAERG